jgi:alkane 1-monooxygenase
VGLRYYGALGFLALVPVTYYTLGPLWSLLAVVLLPLVLIGSEVALPGLAFGAERSNPAFRILPLLYIPLQVVVIGWAIWLADQAPTSWLSFAAVAVSVGIMTGVFGMMSAHEMIHSRSRIERGVGTLLLTAMSYPHFRIAHVYGHHRHAATARDPATARRGESFYAFLPRTIAGQLAVAWRHERIRLARIGRSPLSNRVAGDLALILIVYALLAATGPRGALMFAAESAVAIIALELFNYVAHYGLLRGPGEPFTDRHSWNASHGIGNAILFNMGRHSDHHRRAGAPYQTLQRMEEGPELPAGYAGSMLLALIPPLWRRVMDKRVPRLNPVPAE